MAKVSQIEILGPITSETPHQVREELKLLNNTREVEVLIDSYGGSAAGGLATYDILKETGKKVVVHVAGCALSAAFIIACAGRIRMSQNALLMIHQPSVSDVSGGVREVKSSLQVLESIFSRMVEIVSSRFQMTKEAATEFVERERFMTSSEAFAEGFCDEVYLGDAKNPVSAHWNATVAACAKKHGVDLHEAAKLAKDEYGTLYRALVASGAGHLAETSDKVADSVSEWNRAVADQIKANNCDRVTAIKTVDRLFPGLRAKMLSQANERDDRKPITVISQAVAAWNSAVDSQMGNARGDRVLASKLANRANPDLRLAAIAEANRI